jgi:hypothetical protein
MKKLRVLMMVCVIAATVGMFTACGTDDDADTNLTDTEAVGDTTADDIYDTDNDTTGGSNSGSSVDNDAGNIGDDVEDAGDDVLDGVEDAGDAVIDGAEDIIDGDDTDNTTNTR